MEDERIISLFEQRDERAVSEVKDKYGAVLLAVSKRILHSDSDAEECLSDTLMNLWQHIPPERPECLRAYALKLVRNQSLKKLRYNSTFKRSASSTVPLDDIEAVLADKKALIALENVDLTILLNGFLDTLKSEARVIFIKRYFFCESVSDIAGEHMCSESKVKTTLMRTREKLRKYLYDNGGAI